MFLFESGGQPGELKVNNGLNSHDIFIFERGGQPGGLKVNNGLNMG